MDFTNESVLYVEDDPASRRVMEVFLNYVLKVAHATIWENSEDFVRRLNALDPAPTLILLDIHVDPHTGFEMLSMIREQAAHRETTVIALTASVMNDEIRQLRDAGFDGAVAKPIDQNTFAETLQRIKAGERIWYIG